MSIRVSIIEDNHKERHFYEEFVNRSSDMQCVSKHISPDEALRDMVALQPDVVLFDLKFKKNIMAFDFLPLLKTQLPHTQFLILTAFDDDEDVFRCILAGASGYCLKSDPPEKVIAAIREVFQGGASMSGLIARKVLQQFCKIRQHSGPLPPLSQREQQILQCLAEGQRFRDIAIALNISYDTVRSHVRSIYEKLHVHSRGEAVALYLKSSSLPPL